MIKKETFDILTIIESSYSGFHVTQKKIDAWHLVLVDMGYEQVLHTLKQYMAENEFPPRPAHLTKGLTASSFVTPTSAETKALLAAKQAHDRVAADMQKDELIANMNRAREALGLKTL